MRRDDAHQAMGKREGRNQNSGEEGGMLLALDQGGHSSRALLFDDSGRVVDRCSVEVAVVRRSVVADGSAANGAAAEADIEAGARAGARTAAATDIVEQDPREVIDSLIEAAEGVTRNAASRLGLHVGIACQRSSLVCWRRSNGEPLSPMISWQDRRANDHISQLRAHADEIATLNGLKLSPHYGASKLRWCWEHVPEVREAASQGDLCWGPLGGYLVYSLCRQRPHVVDAANAQRTQLMALSDLNWSPRLLQLFDLLEVPRAAFPTIVDSSYPLGDLDFSWGSAPVCTLTGDQSAVVFADGEPSSGELRMNFGTGAFLQRVSATLPAPHPGLLRSIVHSEVRGTDQRVAEVDSEELDATPGSARDRLSWWVTEAPINGAGAALQEWALRYSRTADDVKRFVADWQPTDDTPLFLNGVSGLAAPYWDPLFESRLVATGEVSAESYGAAVIESILFLTRLNSDLMASVDLEPMSRIIVSGGLTRSDGFCQALADLLQQPVTRSEETEGTCRGVAWWLRQTAAKELKEQSTAEWYVATPARRFDPRPAGVLQARYQQWLRLMPPIPR